MNFLDSIKDTMQLAKNIPLLVAGIFSETQPLVSKKGFVGDINRKSIVELCGKKTKAGVENLKIQVTSANSVLEILPATSSGAKASLDLFNFDDTKKQLIFYCVELSQDSCYCAVYDIQKDSCQTVFDSDIFASEVSFLLLKKSLLKGIFPSLSAPNETTTTANKRSSTTNPKTPKTPPKGNCSPTMAVFPYFNPFNGFFSLQLWHKLEKNVDGVEAKFFSNLRYTNSCFSVVFQAVVQN